MTRIAQIPALDATRARIDDWWSGLSPRERVLVSVLAVILAALVLVYGVVKPLQAARAEARADIRQYETYLARMRVAGRTEPASGQGATRQGAPIAIITASSQQFGLVADAAPIPGGVRVSFLDAPYDGVIGWIADLERTSNLRVRKVELTRRPTAGRVAGSVELAQ